MLSGGSYYIRISLTERNLYLYRGEQLHGAYRVAIGKPSTPSPVGSWTIVNKSVLSGGTVFGTRWMGLSIDNYGIHGNNNPSLIGKAVSLGCIRMYNQDIESIFPLIPIGTPVEITPGARGSGFSLPPYQQKGDPENAGNYGKRIHVVKKGETLWSIAKRCMTNVERLVSLNPGINPDLIYPGQVLYVS
ncbi:MAG: L,D-transpeptidase family protein [Peptococcaceae bacterium]|jgi:hypothetical protein|nr:L,D-transpeptidase family protein [Peptococcaceae bacterium]MDH7525204.1 L,D-transpeptidase family protein [Peptococcaceae bacterium]